MSTENEGNEGNAVPSVPSVPSVPPVPAAAPEGTPQGGTPAPEAPPAAPSDAPTAHIPAAAHQDGAEPPAAGHEQHPYAPPSPQQPPAASAAWPPPPPAIPSYADGGSPPAWGAPEPAQSEHPRRRRAGGLVAAVAVAALVAGGIGGALGYWAADSNDSGSSGSTTVAASNSPKDFKRDAGTVAGVAASALPSVVTIDAQSGDGEGGTGTGFVYDKEGHILTNNHVVASAADSGQLTATFSNGKKYDAEVVGRAQGYDVAVLKLKKAPEGLTPLALGDSDKVAVGDSTIAIGAPFGLSNTVTTGIISAKNRPVASGDGSSNKNSYMSALQTDASINPGNSGGPLLDAGGAVIGINSAIQSTSGGGVGQSQAGSIGLGFAIPVNQAKNVAEQLIKTGQPVYPVIGATVTMEEKTGGAVISDEGAGGTPAVTPNGPAAEAGLKAGDVITKFNDTTVESGPTLIGEIWTHKPGDKVTLTYKRDGKTATAEVTLGERKGDS
ncbi:trypsin-like peptidase domain-containing protein [Streptomyces sp. NE06-03E]|uniref:PDZ domain-containing protein n=1 Tax=Streptomyces sp. gb1(2016) TaxID=1828321 RepID=A0A652KJV5_9ACTN|nr:MULTISPECIES: trypsin-like peptidase domain-containing protein [unclassified Streptomyces]WSS63059.1 trypsin-like peptidase domain-containing protein [Streptomyces sp. NBC_01177]MDX3058953.1 trypsin-like peptidase domain-containing protein [Streptomyces sp. NE06-03E]MDX3429159.1 trypsin-like peptidase domain-containing protein [Streptomyces sp. ME01-18a]RPK38946.1 Periplasmic serine endoprotease DegP precursor [Streptomyces sp. ADI93-02]TXS23288.1 PDZ domain-containing protein [Streptomyces